MNFLTTLAVATVTIAGAMCKNFLIIGLPVAFAFYLFF